MGIPWETYMDMITVKIYTYKRRNKMYYIYCYTNKTNNHKYVGQTNNLQRRIREHRSCALNPKSFSYNHLIHKKLREYGEENFFFFFLETIYNDNIDFVNEREQFWIKEKNSFVGNGQGYNMDFGGNNKEHLRILTDEQITIIKNKIKQGISFIDIQDEFNISASFLSSINHGIYYFEEGTTYPLYKYYKDDSDYDELIDLLLNSTLSLADIAKQLGMGYSTVKKINAGTLRKGLYPTYPIRTKSANEQRADQVKELLLTTNSTYKEIRKLTTASEETIRRINKGLVFKDEKLSYPLRNL